MYSILMVQFFSGCIIFNPLLTKHRINVTEHQKKKKKKIIFFNSIHIHYTSSNIDHPITFDEVDNAIKAENDNKSPGYDSLLAIILKIIHDV